MKFAHLADSHIGGWREPRMREANMASFIKAIERCLAERVDFILISGDLFNTSMPALDALKTTVQQLRKIKNRGIPVYVIPGSHDFSPSGKTILDVIEEAGLFVNVAKGTVTEDGKLKLKLTTDGATGVKITGIVGKKGQLEKAYYADLDRESLEAESGPKIFMFHSALQELKPKELAQMDAMSVSFLPKGFDYYAGGHVHVVDRSDLGTHNNIVYPGPVFPNNFAEMEKLQNGSFVLYDNGSITHIPIKIHPAISMSILAEGKTPSDVEKEILDTCKSKDMQGGIVLIRVSGTLRQGKPSDLQFNDIIQHIYDLGAYFVMKNTNSLSSKEFAQITVSKNSAEDIEEVLIAEHTGKSDAFSVEKEREMVRALMLAFAKEKDEGERVADFEKRVKSDGQRILI